MSAVVAPATSEHNLVLRLRQLTAPDRVAARPNELLTVWYELRVLSRERRRARPRDTSRNGHRRQRVRRVQRHVEPRDAGSVRRHGAADLVLAVPGEVPDRQVER